VVSVVNLFIAFQRPPGGCSMFNVQRLSHMKLHIDPEHYKRHGKLDRATLTSLEQGVAWSMLQSRPSASLRFCLAAPAHHIELITVLLLHGLPSHIITTHSLIIS